MSSRTICPGWPVGGNPCGKEAGTAWTNTWCEDCDLKRGSHVAAACDKNILEPVVVEPAPPPPPVMADYSMFCRDVAEINESVGRKIVWPVSWSSLLVRENG